MSARTIRPLISACLRRSTLQRQLAFPQPIQLQRPFSTTLIKMSSQTGEHQHLKASELFSCKGLTAVVTGGGTGIGLMQTLALVENGAKVFITSRNADKLNDVAKKFGGDGKERGEIIPIAADLSKKEDISKLFDEVKKAAPNGINILMNNAGVAGEGSREGYEDVNKEDPEAFKSQLWKSEFSEWSHIYDVNVISYYFVSAAFLPLLNAGAKNVKGYASQIINTSSISGIMKGASGGQFAYAGSKQAVVQMSKVMAQEFLPMKIRVNQIAPGIFPSEMTAGDSDPHTHKSDLSDTEKGKGLPSGRPGAEDDMAAATLYLASFGGVFLNGQMLHPDGGAVVASPSSL